MVDEPLLVWPSDGGRSALCSADIPWDPTNRGRDSLWRESFGDGFLIMASSLSGDDPLPELTELD